MDFNKLNTSQIIQVKSYVDYTHPHYVYKTNKRKYFSFIFPKEGWYYDFTLGSPEFRTVERIEKGGELFVKDGYVYFYPHIEIRMSNGSLHKKYFKTEGDLKEFYENYLAPLNLIDL